MSMKSKKENSEFKRLLRKHAMLDEATGNVKFSGLYASCYINVCFEGGIVSVPHSHLVWFLKNDKWPTDGLFLDHVNDDPMDNRPCNLQEITPAENQKKRRGRMVYRSYGKGKYGHGMGIYNDKRDGRFYVTHTPSRAGNTTAKTVKISMGGFNTLAEAEEFVESVIERLPS